MGMDATEHPRETQDRCNGSGHPLGGNHFDGILKSVEDTNRRIPPQLELNQALCRNGGKGHIMPANKIRAAVVIYMYNLKWASRVSYVCT